MLIDTEKLFPSGDYILTTYYKGEFYRVRYILCSLTEAKKLFREYIKEEQKKIFYNISK
jgi:hypothetical protein